MLMSCQRTKNDINIKLIPTPRNMVLNAGTSYTMDCLRIGPRVSEGHRARHVAFTSSFFLAVFFFFLWQ